MSQTDDDEIVLKVEKDPLIGKKMAGRYEIVSVLGRGGMGTVYKAHQTDIDRFVAIKTLHLSRVVDSQVIQKFRSEAQAVSRVRHPNTVMVYDFGVSEEGVPFLVMDMLDGSSFRDVLKQSGSVNLGRANHIFQQVCSALASAHDSGIVHKDLKPENIMLSQRQGQPDYVYVLDFGIAGMMESNCDEQREIIGSPPYMSPEQCSAQPLIDHRSDIYSLGVCLFEALCGKFPFQARTAMEMLDNHVSGKPLLLKEMGTRFSTYESTTQVILRCMEKRPEKRYQSAIELADELLEAIKKDSKRGLQLRDRATLEVDAPKASDFVEIKTEEEAQAQPEKNKKGFAESIKTFVRKDDHKDKINEADDSDLKYHFTNCPHCNAPTELGISLCLACGRSLASKDDFSKLRAAKGDFSLPKYQELGSGTYPAQAPSARELNQRARLAMTKSSQARTRLMIIACIGTVLLACAFVYCGGTQLVLDALQKNGLHEEPKQQSTGEQARQQNE